MPKYIVEAESIEDLLDGYGSVPSELVRCKDCIWRLGTDCTRFAEVPVTNEDYCSRAERKRNR